MTAKIVWFEGHKAQKYIERGLLLSYSDPHAIVINNAQQALKQELFG